MVPVDALSVTVVYAGTETMYDFWLRKKPLENSSPPTPLVGLLGSGSDQTAFIAV